jgi:hypothetical protein
MYASYGYIDLVNKKYMPTVFPPSNGSALTITTKWLTHVGNLIMVLHNRWPHTAFGNPVTLYSSIYNHRDSITSSPFNTLEYVYILLYILFLHLFHTLSSYIFPCWQLNITLHCSRSYPCLFYITMLPSLSSSTLKMVATEFSEMFVIYGFISLDKNSPHRKSFRNVNRYKQQVQIAGTCLFANLSNSNSLS